jgi:hypothetical protein
MVGVFERERMVRHNSAFFNPSRAGFPDEVVAL